MAQWDKLNPLQKLGLLHIEVNQLAISVGDLQQTCSDLFRAGAANIGLDEGDQGDAQGRRRAAGGAGPR